PDGSAKHCASTKQLKFHTHFELQALIPHEAETDVAVATAGRVVDAIRRPAIGCVAIPTAAANDAGRSPGRYIYPCSTIICSAIIAVMPIILAPFPHIAVHVE